jgi:hypothetical protein
MSNSEVVGLLASKDLLHPLASMVTSCLFPGFALWAAAGQLAKTDY